MSALWPSGARTDSLKALELRARDRTRALSPVRTFWFGVQRAWERFWYPPTHSFDLGFGRFLFFAWILYSTARRNFVVWGDLPLELFYPLPFMRLINYPVASAATVEILQNLWRLSLIFGMYRISDAYLRFGGLSPYSLLVDINVWIFTGSSRQHTAHICNVYPRCVAKRRFFLDRFIPLSVST